jgi:hypothetical protein
MSKKMKEITNGWVIISNNHPNGTPNRIFSGSFRTKKTRCIKDFVQGSGGDWNYWKNKYGFKAVRATQTITT